MEENLGEIEKVIREKEKEEIKEIKRRLRKKIIIVKNDMEEEIQIGERIEVMDEGKILKLGKKEEIMERKEKELVERMVGKGERKLRIIQIKDLKKVLKKGDERGEKMKVKEQKRDEMEEIIWQGRREMKVIDEEGRQIGRVKLEKIMNKEERKE